jgi:hypothetical protein
MRSPILFAVLLASSTLAFPINPRAQPIKVPLTSRNLVDRATGLLDLGTYLTHLNYTIQKYTHQSLKTYTDSNGSILSSILKRQNAEEALTDQVSDDEDVLYYGSGNVGGQDGFTFDFDTGSSDTFVPGPKCGAAEGCVGNVKYDNGGQDEGTTTTVTYGSGQVTGENYFDSVTVAGLTAKKQNVIVS